MVYGKDELLYVTGMGNIVKNKQNTEGDDMKKIKDKVKVVTVNESELSRYNRGLATTEVMEYRENGVVVARGEGVLCTVESYLKDYLGYDLSDIFNDYEWRDFPDNKDYEVCELGLVRNKNTNNLLAMSLKYDYEKGSKEVWRIRVSIPGNRKERVSQIVAETFLEDKPESKDNDYFVGHINDIPLDNRVENLEYVTRDENVTIDWVLREIGLRGLTLSYVEDVFEQIKEVVEDKYGLPVDRVGELTKEDAEEVQDYIEVYNRTVQDIYNYKVYGTGVLSRIGVDGDRFII